MKIAIVGSREGFTKEDINKYMSKHFDFEYDRLITGGAKGVDSFAIEIADKGAKSPHIIRPISPSSKLSYLFRNVEIITEADKIIAFWNGKSKGTKFVIDYAKARNKLIKVIKNGT